MAGGGAEGGRGGEGEHRSVELDVTRREKGKKGNRKRTSMEKAEST